MKIIQYELDAVNASGDSRSHKVDFRIDTALAKKILSIATLVKENGLLKAAMLTNADWFINGSDDGEEDEQLQTDIDQIVVYENLFHVGCAIKHTDHALTSSGIYLSKLTEDFGLDDEVRAPVPLPCATAKSFVIRSFSEGTDAFEFAYWNNDSGWGAREGCTEFTREETQTISRPLSAFNDAEFEAVVAVVKSPVDFSNLGETAMGFVEDQLSNNDVASDDELAVLFKDSGLSDVQVKAALAQRTFYLCNIVHGQNSPLRRRDDVQVFRPDTQDFGPVTK